MNAASQCGEEYLRRAARLIVTLLFPFLFLFCSASDSDDARSFKIERRAEGHVTHVINERGWRSHLDSIYTLAVEEVWRSDSLERPSDVVRINDTTLLVADRSRLHIVVPERHSGWTYERPGSGPGEFRSVGGIAAWSRDTVVVWDPQLARLTWLTASGHVGRSRQAEHPRDNYTDALPLVRRHENGILWAWKRGLISVGGPPREITVFWTQFTGDNQTDTPLLSIEEARMIRAGRVVVPAAPFGARPILAFGPDAKIAASDGVEYCFRVHGVASRQVMRVCREWEPVELLESVRKGRAAEEIPLEGLPRQVLDWRLEVQEFGKRKNAIRELLFDHHGRVWVQVVDDADEPDPMLTGPYPELRPPTYLWDIYDENGERLAAVRLSSRFRPYLIERAVLYGFYVLDTGEKTLSQVSVPPELQAAFSD